ncbi:MAG TPA: V-type ATP synthase subunit I [Desulfatiglandales bacterium]|nr:V-type ATP synthase subunit I [Desulfatiglandales bacterium]
MFRPTRMKKIQILALEGFRYDITKRFQELGAIQLSDYSEKLSEPAWNEVLSPHPSSPNIRKISAQNIVVNRFLDLFERHHPENKVGFIRGLFAPLPPKKLETKEIFGNELISVVDDALEKVGAEVEEPVKEAEKIEEEIAELVRKRELLNWIMPLEIDLADIRESDFLSFFLGIMPKEEMANITGKLKELAEEKIYLGARETYEDKLVTIVVCLKDHASLVLSNLRRMNWERIEIDDQQGRPAEAINSVDKRLAFLKEEKTREEGIIIGIAKRWRDELKKYQEFLMAERQREESQSKYAKMEHVVAIEGWVPKHLSAQAVQEIREVSREACVVEISDPEEKDNVPVSLKNPKFFRSFELLTRLYGLPTYDGVDPTLFLVPGFLLFFSIMLTDAVYGLIALVLGLSIIRGGGKYNQSIKDAGVILSSAGAVTIIIGALSGGWLGDFGLKLPVLAAMQVFDPMVQVTAFLLIALIIGLTHVNVGIVINVWDNIEKKKIWKAIKENFWFLFAQPGLIFFLMGYKTVGIIFLIISVILLLTGHKAMAMFAVTGLMGDILSYARLMALGLCTTGIAMTVNVLSGMLYVAGSVGVVIASVVFIFGHLFNFVINVMGSFVHGLRLHYVEFFTKFYQSGGTEFTPLETRFESVKIK